jgi:hypothetical protein
MVNSGLVVILVLGIGQASLVLLGHIFGVEVVEIFELVALHLVQAELMALLAAHERSQVDPLGLLAQPILVRGYCSSCALVSLSSLAFISSLSARSRSCCSLCSAIILLSCSLIYE